MATETAPPPAADAPGGTSATAPPAGRAALLGVLALALTIAVSELFSALTTWWGLFTSSSSPVASLGAAVIDVSPGPVVEWAKQTLGAPGDKIALGIGIGVVMLLAGVGLGLLARVRLGAAMIAALLLAAVAAWAISERADAGLGELFPLAIGTAVGLGYLSAAFGERRRPGYAPPGSTLAADPVPSAGRRRFLQLAGYGALGVVVAGVLSRVIPAGKAVDESRASVKLKDLGTADAAPTGTLARPTGAAAPAVTGTFDDVAGISSYVTPNSEFYRIDTAFSVPQVTTADWKLRIHGLVDNEIELSFPDLQSRTMIERMITLTCVSNPRGGDLVGNALWQGVRIADILAEAGVQPGADCVLSSDVKGFTVSTPLEALTDDRDALLAIGMNGEPLPLEHGFPVRMVVPGVYGYVSATKWVVDMEVTRFADVMAYWTGLGWSERGPIKTSSRIDVPSADGSADVNAGSVTVAGVAWAQHKGIEAVQVQFRLGEDDWGDWNDAELSRPVSTDTWVQWRYDWDAAPGDYRVRCRAIDSTGAEQIGEDSPVIPDGATGYHQIPVSVHG